MSNLRSSPEAVMVRTFPTIARWRAWLRRNHGRPGRTWVLKSVWSLSNKRRIEQPTAESRMQAPGLARVADAKASGAWERAYGARSTPPMSGDEREKLKAEGLREAWGKLAPSRRLDPI
jgi:hypothetical protein